MAVYAFLALAGLLAAAIGAAVAWPLRSTSPRTFMAVVLLLPVLTIGLYRILGTPAALNPEALRPAGADGPATMAEAIAELRAELERNPAQPDGWLLLGRSLAMQGDPAAARDAFARALELMPDDAGLLVEAAQSRAQADPGSRFDDEAVAMLRKAIAIDPSNQRAPWFLGIAQRQRGQPADAAATWEALLPRLDATTATALRQQIDAARSDAGLPPLPAGPATTAGGLRVRVALDPDFAARVRLRGDAAVFVIARIPGGPPMPVAAERHALQDLPLDIVLDDGDSPMPTQPLSSLKEVEVLARLSASGNAMRQQGDLESAPVRVTLPTGDAIELVIGAPAP